jgi:hypothetical protein
MGYSSEVAFLSVGEKEDKTVIYKQMFWTQCCSLE